LESIIWTTATHLGVKFLEAAVFLQRIEQFRGVERFGEHPQRARLPLIDRLRVCSVVRFL
jgi:hypothetical protein